MTIPRWNLISRLVFRLYSSGGDCVDRPPAVFQNTDTLVLTPESASSFASFTRMLAQFAPGNTVYFQTNISNELEIVSTIFVNNTPRVTALPI